jgi:hypothetical protein
MNSTICEGESAEDEAKEKEGYEEKRRGERREEKKDMRRRRGGRRENSHNNILVLWQSLCQLHTTPQTMRTLQSRNNPL